MPMLRSLLSSCRHSHDHSLIEGCIFPAVCDLVLEDLCLLSSPSPQLISNELAVKPVTAWFWAVHVMDAMDLSWYFQ